MGVGVRVWTRLSGPICTGNYDGCDCYGWEFDVNEGQAGLYVVPTGVRDEEAISETAIYGSL